MSKRVNNKKPSQVRRKNKPGEAHRTKLRACSGYAYPPRYRDPSVGLFTSGAVADLVRLDITSTLEDGGSGEYRFRL